MSSEEPKEDDIWCKIEHDSRDNMFLCKICGLYLKYELTSHIHQAYDTFCERCFHKHSPHPLFIFSG